MVRFLAWDAFGFMVLIDLLPVAMFLFGKTFVPSRTTDVNCVKERSRALDFSNKSERTPRSDQETLEILQESFTDAFEQATIDAEDLTNLSQKLAAPEIGIQRWLKATIWR